MQLLDYNLDGKQNTGIERSNVFTTQNCQYVAVFDLTKWQFHMINLIPYYSLIP